MGSGDDPVLARTPAWAIPTYPSAGVRTWDAAADSVFRDDYPTLYEFLTLGGYLGKQRKTGTVLIFAEDSKWKACLNDREGGRYAFMSAEGVAPLLRACDEALEAGKVDWRESKNKR